MAQKIIKIKNINSIRKYLTIFSGIFQLTDAELDVLAEMITYQLKGALAKKPVDPFSSAAKKHVASALGLSNPYSVNTYLQRLRTKGVVLQTAGGNQIFHPWIMPKGEAQIVIEPQWNLNFNGDPDATKKLPS